MQLPQHISVDRARLPQSYEAAKNALANCMSIDECQTWANKAEALASYAKQANDDSLQKYAMRIQARAVRRAGELLKMYDGRGGDRTKTEVNRHSAPSRRDAAKKAGLSEWKTKAAVRVASVPEEDFERAIEADTPPNITNLAGMNKPPEGFRQATHLIGAVKRFAEFCGQNNPERVANGVLPHEAHEIRALVSTIDGWLDRFVVNLKDSA